MDIKLSKTVLISEGLINAAESAVNFIAKPYLPDAYAIQTAFAKKHHFTDSHAVHELLKKEEALYQAIKDDIKPQNILIKYLKRAMVIPFAILALPFIAISLFLGLAIRASAKRESIVLVKAKCEAPGLSKKTDLKAVTFNVALSQFELMNQVNRLPSTDERLQACSDFMIDTDADVYALQEAFACKRIQQQMIPQLSEKGYHVAYATDLARLLGMSSGIMLASKYPIEKTAFQTWEDKGGEDKWATKGVLLAIINVKGKRILQASLHMNGTFAGEVERGRGKQAAQLKAFIETFAKENALSEGLVLGDFNISRFELHGSERIGPVWDYPEFVESVNEEAGYTEITGASEVFEVEKNSKMTYSVDELERRNESGKLTGATIDTRSISYFNPKPGQEVLTKPSCDDHAYHYQKPGSNEKNSLFAAGLSFHEVLDPRDEKHRPISDHRPVCLTLPLMTEMEA